MKVRYIGPIDEVVTIIPGDEPHQFTAKRGDEIALTKAQALIVLLNDNYEPADKAASALVAAPAAETE